MTTLNTDLITELQRQFNKAITKHPPYPSLHHGISVIDEEFIELKTEAYKQTVDWAALKKEAFHVAVTALRLIEDIADKQKFDGGWPTDLHAKHFVEGGPGEPHHPLLES